MRASGFGRARIGRTGICGAWIGCARVCSTGVRSTGVRSTGVRSTGVGCAWIRSTGIRSASARRFGLLDLLRLLLGSTAWVVIAEARRAGARATWGVSKRRRTGRSNGEAASNHEHLGKVLGIRHWGYSFQASIFGVVRGGGGGVERRAGLCPRPPHPPKRSPSGISTQATFALAMKPGMSLTHMS